MYYRQQLKSKTPQYQQTAIMKATILTLLLVLLAAVPDLALAKDSSLRTLFARANGGDHQAVADLISLADKEENPYAATFLGYIYDHGLAGIQQDFQKALEYTKRGSAANIPTANYNLGQFYLYGRNEVVEQNIEKAFSYFIAANENNNNPKAMIKLGECKQLAGDQKAAVSWYLQAAKRSQDPLACRKLGYAYLTGKGTIKNKNVAIKWLMTAADKMDIQSQYLLALAYARGNTRTDRIEAAKWLQIAAAYNKKVAKRAKRYVAALGADEANEAKNRTIRWLDQHPITQASSNYNETIAIPDSELMTMRKLVGKSIADAVKKIISSIN